VAGKQAVGRERAPGLATARTRPALARDEVDRLFRRVRAAGDPAARDALIESFLPLARGIALRYRRPREPLDDLFQVASLGLVKAVDRFDPSRGVAFSTYAVPTMTGEVKRYRRDVGWAVHVPRALQEDTLRVEAAIERLSQGGRSPTPADVASHLEMSPEDVLAAIEAGLASRAASLDAPCVTDGASETAGDRFGHVDFRYELVDLDATLSQALEDVAPRERAILYLRFVEDRTQSEIARSIGISQMQVSRLIRRTLKRLRDAIADGPMVSLSSEVGGNA
jgi:RNA polymerase sigma-B factor